MGEDVGVYGGGFGVGRSVEGESFCVCGGCYDEGKESGLVGQGEEAAEDAQRGEKKGGQGVAKGAG